MSHVHVHDLYISLHLVLVFHCWYLCDVCTLSVCLPTGGTELQLVIIDDTQGTISYLKPDTSYTFYLRAYNVHGTSPPSQRVTYTTSEWSECERARADVACHTFIFHFVFSQCIYWMSCSLCE